MCLFYGKEPGAVSKVTLSSQTEDLGCSLALPISVPMTRGQPWFLPDSVYSPIKIRTDSPNLIGLFIFSICFLSVKFYLIHFKLSKEGMLILPNEPGADKT